MKFRLLILILTSILSGCATTEVSTEFNQGTVVQNRQPLGAINAENYGYYLFGILPIVSGAPDEPNEVSLTFFEDTVTIENNQKMLNLEVEKLGTDTLTDVRHHTSWTGSFSFWIIWRQVLSSNALALKNIELPSQKTDSSK